MTADRVRPWARSLLAVLLGLVAVGVIAMHLLSAEHHLATAAVSASQITDHAEHSHPATEMPTDHHHGAGALHPGELSVVGHGVLTGAAVGQGCRSACEHDGMMVGACLLAFGAGATWLVARPLAARLVWHAVIATARTARTARTAPGRAGDCAVPRRLALTHQQLSIIRT